MAATPSSSSRLHRLLLLRLHRLHRSSIFELVTCISRGQWSITAAKLSITDLPLTSCKLRKTLAKRPLRQPSHPLRQPSQRPNPNYGKKILGWERLLWHVAASHCTVNEPTLVNQSTLGKDWSTVVNLSILFYTWQVVPLQEP